MTSPNFQRAPSATNADPPVTVSYAWIGWATAAFAWLLGGSIGVAVTALGGPGPGLAAVPAALIVTAAVLFTQRRRTR